MPDPWGGERKEKTVFAEYKTDIITYMGVLGPDLPVNDVLQWATNMDQEITMEMVTAPRHEFDGLHEIGNALSNVLTRTTTGTPNTFVKTVVLVEVSRPGNNYRPGTRQPMRRNKN